MILREARFKSILVFFSQNKPANNQPRPKPTAFFWGADNFSSGPTKANHRGASVLLGKLSAQDGLIREKGYPLWSLLAGAYWWANEQQMAIFPTKRRANEQLVGGWAPTSLSFRIIFRGVFPNKFCLVNDDHLHSLKLKGKPQKIGLPKRKVVFQLSIFRGYVKLPGV